MEDPGAGAFSFQDAFHLELAARVGGYDPVQVELQGLFQAGLADGGRKPGKLHRESSAETAAEPVRPKGNHLQAFHGPEKPKGLLFDPQAPQEVASHVKGRPAGKPGRNLLQAQVLPQEFREFPEAAAKVCIPGEEAGKFVSHHGHAGSRGGHDHLFVLEALQQGLAHLGGQGGQARVVGRLAAAGLAPGNDHLVAQLLQEADRGLSHLGEDVVHEAGHEEGDSHETPTIPSSKGGRPCMYVEPFFQESPARIEAFSMSPRTFFFASFFSSFLPLLWGAPGGGPPEKLLTVAEASGYERTGTTREVWTFLREVCRRSGDARLEVMGRSPQGREIPLVIAGRPLPDAPIPRAGRERPVIYLQANIHAGEVAGKEALQILLRRILLEGDMPGLLDQAVLLVCPDFNTDGNDRISPRNRFWQNGPAGGVGVRYNGQGLDLNRDAVKLESREMRALLSRVILPWDPDLLVDCHTTDGSLHVHPLEAEGPLLASMDGKLRAWNRDVFLPAVFADVKKEWGLDFLPYGFFLDRRAPSKGWGTFPPLPRYLTNYMGARGRLSVLSEAYVYKSFRERVRATLALVRAILAEAAARSGRLLALVRGADERARSLAARGGRFGVKFQAVPRKKRVTVRGYAEKGGRRGGRAWKERLAGAGPLKTWKIPAFAEFMVLRDVAVPGGWLLPPGAGEAAALLRRHGIRVKRLGAPRNFQVRQFDVLRIQRDRRPFQGHRLVHLEGSYERVEVRVPAGSYYVSSRTPLCRLACWLLEPESPDGLTTWGFFDPWLKEGSPHPVLAVISQE